MKWIALAALGLLQLSCTTLANRRDLYSPQPSPELLARNTTVTTTTHTETEFRTAPAEEITPPAP